MSATIIVRSITAPAGRVPVRSATAPPALRCAPERHAAAPIGARRSTRRPGHPSSGHRSSGHRPAGDGPVRSPAHPSAATYRRRRAVVGIVLAALVAVGAVLAHDVLAGSGGDPASAAASQPARTPATVAARPGDTLWAIAQRHRGEVPISRYVDALVDANGGAAIQAGQAVVLP